MADSDSTKLIKLLRDLKDVVEQIKHKVDNIQIFQTSASENINLMKEQQSLMNEKLDHLEKDVGGLKKDLGTVKVDIKEIQENVDAARGDIESLHQALLFS